MLSSLSIAAFLTEEGSVTPYRLLVALLPAVVACGRTAEFGSPAGPRGLTEASPSFAANIGICNGVYDDVDPSCNGQNAQIGLVASGPGADPDAQLAIANAIGPWQLLLRPSKDLGVPQVSLGYMSKTVFVRFPSATGDVCGRTPAPGGVIDTIFLTPAASCGSIQTGPREVVIRHEVAHVLGWDQSHGGFPARNSSVTGPYTGRCTTFLHLSKNDGPIPPGVCPHEVEVINRAYTSGWTADQNGLYDQEMLLRTDASRTLSVAVGATATIATPHWVSWPSDQLVSRTAYDLSWTVTPSTIAAVTGTGVVTGSQAGTGAVWLRAQSAAPSGFGMWTPFRLRGDSVELTVTAPPAVALQVSDVVIRDSATNAIVSLPITVAATYTIDAVVIGTPTWTHINWGVIDSRSPYDTSFSVTQNPDTRQTFRSYPGDSYRRRFLMQPLSGSYEGFYHVRDIPLCVTGADQFRVAGKLSAKVGVVPDAISGCS